MKGYLRKRGKSWSYTVDIGRDPITNKRKQKSRGGFKTKKEAHSALAKIISEYEQGEYVVFGKRKMYKTAEFFVMPLVNPRFLLIPQVDSSGTTLSYDCYHLQIELNESGGSNDPRRLLSVQDHQIRDSILRIAGSL